MPRYFFNVYIGDDAVRDPDGIAAKLSFTPVTSHRASSSTSARSRWR